MFNMITHRDIIRTLNKLANAPETSTQVLQSSVDDPPYKEGLVYANRYRNLTRNYTIPWKEAAKRYWKYRHNELWDSKGNLNPGVALGGLLGLKTKE